LATIRWSTWVSSSLTCYDQIGLKNLQVHPLKVILPTLGWPRKKGFLTLAPGESPVRIGSRDCRGRKGWSSSDLEIKRSFHFPKMLTIQSKISFEKHYFSSKDTNGQFLSLRNASIKVLLEGVLAPSSHCSTLTETLLASKNKLSIAPIGSTSSKFDHYSPEGFRNKCHFLASFKKGIEISMCKN